MPGPGRRRHARSVLVAAIIATQFAMTYAVDGSSFAQATRPASSSPEQIAALFDEPRGPGLPLQGPPTTMSPEQVAAAAEMQVMIMTVGQGDQVWEKFGHNAIWLRDDRTGLDVAYNYGIFDAFESGFIGRLIKGEMVYRMEGYAGAALANHYVQTNRTIWVQELDLTAVEKAELRAFLEWNDLEENRNYVYQYYRDNCSTRVRDAIDRVLGGVIQTRLEAEPTGTTYRWHTSRLTAATLPAYTGLSLALGQPIDQPINAWEASFLPVQLMGYLNAIEIAGDDGETRPLVLDQYVLFEADRPSERDEPPARIPAYLVAGLLIGGLLVWLGVAAGRRRPAAIAFFTIAITWTVVAGVFGTLIAGIWALTGHYDTYANENVLQLNILSLLLLPLLIAFARGGTAKAATRLAAGIAALSLLGLLIQVLPGLDQVNGIIIGLALPIHTGLAAGVLAIRKERDRQMVPN